MKVTTSQLFLLFSLIATTFAIAAPTTTAPKKVDKKSEALRVIENTRGGRHWADAETAPPKSPEESMKTFQIEPGLEIELVASEPLVFDPVAVAFDQNGHLYAVEYTDYPIGSPDGKPLSKVVLLEDTNGDGKSDVRHVFAEGLKFGHSLLPYKGGIIVGTTDEVLFLKDTDGDHKADIRKPLYTGFKEAHSQMHIGCPRWGMDNMISLNYGAGTITGEKNADKPFKMPRKDFLFDPVTMEFQPDSGLGQFGNTVDRWGHRFYATNRNPVMMSRIPYDAMKRNPYVVISKGHIDVAPSGGDSKVYPLLEMKSNYLSHAGTHTSACGTTAYTGDLLGEKFYNSVFVCEPVGNLVTHTKISPEENGSGLTGIRAREKADFIASSDPWFRPGSLANGPDGSVYLADMYRLWVEHPKFVPEEVSKKLDWRAGEKKGRIWRIKPKGAKARPFTPPKSTADKVALLKDPNGWRRYLGQRLIVEDQLVDAESSVRKILQSAELAESRLHALWTLDGLGKLKAEDVLLGFKDSHSEVRRSAVRLCPKFDELDGEYFFAIEAMARDESPSVRFELALAVGDPEFKGPFMSAPHFGTILSELLISDGDDPWLVNAVLASSKGYEGALIELQLENEEFASHAQAWKVELLKKLASAVGAGRESNSMVVLLKSLANKNREGLWWKSAMLSGLAEGLYRYRGSLKRQSLESMVANPPSQFAKYFEEVKSILESTKDFALDESSSLEDRVAAIELLGYLPFKKSVEAYEDLLTSAQPGGVQLATISAMGNGGTDAAELILERWPELGPQVREPALIYLLRRRETTYKFFDAMREGVVQRSAISIDQRVKLLKHPDPKIKLAATELLGGAVSANRKAVASEYRAALELKTSVDAGALVFEKTCSKCHKRNGKGFVVGPDISDVRNRSKEALLYDLLDPNSKVEPRFADYVIISNQGKTYNGLMVSESSEAVVLRQAGGKEVVIPRNEIARLQASGKSLMPEGIEKEVSIQQMADLLEFLKSGK